MSRATPRHPQAATTLLAAASLLALASYALFLFAPRHVGHPLSYTLLCVAEAIGMVNAAGIWIILLLSPAHPPLPDAHEERRALERGKVRKTIAVFITVAGEAVETVRRTVVAAKAMRGAHRTFLLDDGGSADVRAMAAEIGVEYLSRPVKDGKKAGNINYALSQVPCDFFAILDCDHVPAEEFLTTLAPYLLQDERVAFVQSPQFYGNTDTFVAGGGAEMQESFYQHIQSRKNLHNAAFCVGTNVVFRRSAVEEIGGIYHKSNSEDIWTAYLLHERGWKSLYVPRVLAVGETPETVDAFFRQQMRWARGGFEILLTRNPLLNTRLTWAQRLHYLHTTLYYLNGFSVLLFFVLPLLHVYFGWKPVNAPGEPFAWLLRFLPYYILTFVSSAYLLGRSPQWRSFAMTGAAFVAHISAFFSALTGKSIRWSVTGTIRRKSDYLASVFPHLLLLLLTLGAIPVVLLKPYEQPLTWVFVLWMSWNCAVLFAVCKRAIPRYAHAKEPSDVTYYYPLPSVSTSVPPLP